MVAFNKSNCAA